MRVGPWRKPLCLIKNSCEPGEYTILLSESFALDFIIQTFPGFWRLLGNMCRRHFFFQSI